MTVIVNITLATLAVSLISLAGVCLIRVSEATLEWLLEYLVSFAVGGLLGGAFLHLFPEAVESGNTYLFSYSLAGIIFFFLMERFLRWRHCHLGRCEAHSFTYISLIGDGNQAKSLGFQIVPCEG
ncbi:ZIP family metal transporter [uncultured Desulfobulbus sp.]|uniref:ZIP family metal transporter n=1 Tax=uncultured Desulfobulbus sp. TaxID=239745 RepID=UPI0029C63207|nr:ZIP family metal transporter [uncultured Desulfobulbus sp.]